MGPNGPALSCGASATLMGLGKISSTWRPPYGTTVLNLRLLHRRQKYLRNPATKVIASKGNTIMTAEMIKSLVPFGIIGLAIVALLIIAISPTKNGFKFALGPMLLIAILALVDRYLPTPGLLPGDHGDGTAAARPLTDNSNIYWTDSGTNADWGGRDYAYTSSPVPKYRVKDASLCDANRVGYVATCWDARPNGFPPNVDLTDVPRGTTPAQWCTYKDNQIRLSTPPDGHAPAGRVFICAHVVGR
jgi:hypothetical protein